MCFFVYLCRKIESPSPVAFDYFQYNLMRIVYFTINVLDYITKPLKQVAEHRGACSGILEYPFESYSILLKSKNFFAYEKIVKTVTDRWRCIV